MSQKKQFFISYRSVNRPQVERLVLDIKALGHEVWFDKELTGGKAWWDQIMEQVRACDYVIAALSPEVIKSKPCSEERNYARQLGKTILPVIIASNVIITHFEPELGQIQAIDYSDFDNKQAALALARAIDQLPAPVPLPVPIPLQPEVPASYLNTLREKVNKRDLSYQEQSAILGDLKRSTQDFDSPRDIIPLIEQFLNRPDISVQINQDAQSFLQTLQTQTPVYGTSADQLTFEESTFHQPSPQVAKVKPKNTDAWSDGMYFGFFAVGFLLPIIGVGIGLYGMFVGNPAQAKKDQGRNVLIFSVVMWFIWTAVFNEMANSFYY